MIENWRWPKSQEAGGGKQVSKYEIALSSYFEEAAAAFQSLFRFASFLARAFQASFLYVSGLQLATEAASYTKRKGEGQLPLIPKPWISSRDYIVDVVEATQAHTRPSSLEEKLDRRIIFHL